MTLCPICSAENLSQADWHYCWRCGSVLSRIAELVDDVDYASPGLEHCQHVPITPSGRAPIEVVATLEVASLPVPKLLSDHMIVNGDASLDVIWPPNEENGHATLLIRTNDGPREDRWQRRTWRVQQISVARFIARKELAIEPAELLFTPGRKQRALALVNLGRMPLEVQRVQVPFGYRWATEESLPRVLRPGERIEGLLHRSGEAAPKSGQLSVEYDNGTEAAAITCRGAEVPTPVPPYTVGIDFGTSHTSIVVRKADQRDVIFLGPESMRRFPTAIFCGSPDESTWKYGPEAFTDYDKAKTATGARGRLVLELKRYMQNDREDLFDDWPGITAHTLLVWYLQQLLDDHILPFFRESNRKTAMKQLLFIMSFPVYDGEEHAIRQRDATLNAARKAGFETYGRLEWAYEPVCAACYLLLGRGDLAIQPGERIMVFDSGGGTTDVCMGTVAREGDTLTLKNIAKGAATLDEGRQFGGTSLTSRMGKKLFQAHGSNFLARVLLAYGQQDANVPLFSTFLESEKVDPFGAIERWPWVRKYPDTFMLVDLAKRRQAKAPDTRPAVYEEVDNRRGIQIPLDKMMTQLTAGEGMELIAPSLRDFVKRDKPDQVFAVGGNSLIPKVREHLGFVVKMPVVELTEDDRNLAVAYGTVWVRELVLNSLEYGIAIHSDLSGEVGHYEEGARPDPTPTGHTYRMPPETTLRFRVDGLLASEPVTLFRPSIANDTGETRLVEIQFALESNELIMSHDLYGDRQVCLRYEI